MQDKLGIGSVASWAIEAIGLHPLLLPPYWVEVVDELINVPSTKTNHISGTVHVVSAWHLWTRLSFNLGVYGQAGVEEDLSYSPFIHRLL
jgi:hypothetical protein